MRTGTRTGTRTGSWIVRRSRSRGVRNRGVVRSDSFDSPVDRRGEVDYRRGEVDSSGRTGVPGAGRDAATQTRFSNRSRRGIRSLDTAAQGRRP